MNYSAVIRDTETGRGRGLIVSILALLLVAIVIGAVARGFRGTSTEQGARALSSAPAALLADATPHPVQVPNFP